MLSQSAALVASTPQSDVQGSKKVAFRCFLGHLLGTAAGLWSDFGLEVSTESLQRDFTGAREPPHPKNVPRAVPKGLSAAGASTLRAPDKTVLWHPGRSSRLGKRTFWHRGCFADSEKQRDLSYVAAS